MNVEFKAWGVVRAVSGYPAAIDRIADLINEPHLATHIVKRERVSTETLIIYYHGSANWQQIETEIAGRISDEWARKDNS